MNLTPASRFPRKAVILAAGFGTWMFFFSLDTPKPMMPLWGKPMAGHILDMLARWHVEDVLINLHHQPETICDYVRRRPASGPRIALSFEPTLLGTGGALRKASWFLDTQPFWVINADIAADVDPRPLMEAFHRSRLLAALWMTAERGPRTVSMTDGRITDFSSNRPGTEGTYTFCGLHLLSPRILQFIPPHGFFTIVRAYQQAMAQGEKIAGVCVEPSYWADIGTPDGYIEAHREILQRAAAGKPGAALLDAEPLRRMRAWRRRIRFHGFLSAGRHVVIGKGARMTDAVIWDRARVASDAIVEKAVIGTGCTVHGRVPRVAVRSAFSLSTAGNMADIPLAMTLQSLRWRPSETTVIPFEPRGSARLFTRLESRGRRVILVRYSMEREENALYTRHARFLQSIGLPVPRIILDSPEKNFFVMQDLGDQSLQSLRSLLPLERLSALYRHILPSVARWHTEGTRASRRRRLMLVAPFSSDVYRWEREFFGRYFLIPHLHPPPEKVPEIMDELSVVAGALLKAPAVLVHRDLQSSNIIRVGSRHVFIDFQGMRFGAAAYDLAALLCDPYVELPPPAVESLLAAYNRLIGKRQRVAEPLFWKAAIQRLAQALGVYGRLSANPETAWFGKYIAPGLRMMRRALERSGACPRLLSALRGSGNKVH